MTENEELRLASEVADQIEAMEAGHRTGFLHKTTPRPIVELWAENIVRLVVARWVHGYTNYRINRGDSCPSSTAIAEKRGPTPVANAPTDHQKPGPKSSDVPAPPRRAR